MKKLGNGRFTRLNARNSESLRDKMCEYLSRHYGRLVFNKLSPLVDGRNVGMASVVKMALKENIRLAAIKNL